MNSCVKGKGGEREWAEILRSFGVAARRGRQYSGNPDSPDVISALPFHWEVKRTERFNAKQAMAQSIGDAAGGKVPVVAHRQNRCEWLITMRAADFLNCILPAKQAKKRSLRRE